MIYFSQSATQRDGELVIQNVQPDDSGLYLCRVTVHNGYIGEATTRINIARS